MQITKLLFWMPVLWVVLSHSTPSYAELPHWIDNPQQAADEDEIAFLGTAESPKGMEDAKHNAHEDAIQKAVTAVVELLNSGFSEIKKEIAAGMSWDDAVVRKSVRGCAEKHFRSIPYEKWHGTMAGETDGEQTAKAYVFLQFPRMDIARLVIDCVSGHIRQDKTSLSEQKAKIRRAVGTVTTDLPP